MKPSAAAAATGVVAALAGVVAYTSPLRLEAARAPKASLAEIARHVASVRAPATTISTDTLTAVVQRVCAECHNEGVLAGELSLEKFNVADAVKTPATAEKMIAKLRAGMMPPPSYKGPTGDTLTQLAATLEQLIDRDAVMHPNPGGRTFQRLNRAEYERSIHDLLKLD